MSERHPIFDRIGQFKIPRAELERGADWLWQLFARVIVLRCELVAYSDSFEYTAAGPDFEKAEPGMWPKPYTPVLRKLDDGTVIFQGFDG